MVLAALGILKAGAAYLPLDEDHPPGRVVSILADSGADALVTRSAPALIAAEVACGREPIVRPTRHRAAAVCFLYPDRNAIARDIVVDRDHLPSTVVDVEPIAMPGQELRLPPDGHVSSRYALLTAVADTPAQCLADLGRAAGAVRLECLDPPC